MLSDEERARFRAEEEFRRAVREDLDATAKQRTSKLWRFFNSQVGGWLLGTVLVGLTSWGYAAYREAQTATQTKAQKEVELVTKLLPELAKLGSADSILASAMLGHLKTTGGIDSGLAKLIGEALSVAARSSGEQAKSAQGPERSAYVASAEAAVKALGSPKLSPPSPESKSAAPQIPADRGSSLPNTVYIQIADESQRGMAEQLRTRLRETGLPVPAIENVGRKSPSASDVRYYFDSDLGTANQIVAAAKAVGVRVDTPRKLPLLPDARPGLLEMWIGRNEKSGSVAPSP